MINKATEACEKDIIAKVTQKNTSMIRKNHGTLAPYQHPNRLNQSMYQRCLEQRQYSNYISKNINSDTFSIKTKVFAT